MKSFPGLAVWGGFVNRDTQNHEATIDSLGVIQQPVVTWHLIHAGTSNALKCQILDVLSHSSQGGVLLDVLR